MKAFANERRDYVIAMLVAAGETQKSAEADNDIDKHIIGVTAEYAVEEWLKEQGIVVQPNFQDVAADFRGEPDIVVVASGVRCDVKSSFDHKFPERQRGSLDRKDIVIWCWSRRVGPEYKIEIYGWTTANKIKPLDAEESWIEVPREEVNRDLDALLARLR